MKIRLSRIALLLAFSTVLTGVAGVAATYIVAKDEFRELLEDDLKSQSRLLSKLLASDANALTNKELTQLLSDVFEEDDEDTLWVNVYDRHSGQLASNLRHELPAPDGDHHELTLQLDGHTWEGRQREEGPLLVQLLRRDDYLEHVREEVLEDIATPVLAVGAINLLLLATFIAMVLRPVTRLSRQIETRNADSLEPLSVKTSTLEVAVLRDTVNRLISGIDEVLTRERQFANDVAHELRTPLTTLKLELASNDPDLETLKYEVNRLTQLVGQMLTLARVEQAHLRQSFKAIQLDQLCLRELERLRPRIDAVEMQVQTSLAPLTVAGDEVLLGSLFSNLLLNVIHHCAPGTEIAVSLEQVTGAVRLSVEDNGPGIEASQVERLNKGFTRMDSRSSGHGLGLAICRKIAEVHGATLTFLARDDSVTGLRVQLDFPD
ncbi:MAG TPA: ATP-binding protein [Woeseiaceae bacterium]|nr:ATP-binding protein [Woeseiaceae bacterium]